MPSLPRLPRSALHGARTPAAVSAGRVAAIALLGASVGEHLPWAATQGITAHWLRHTTLTWVERNFGYAVARAYAGHEGGLAGAGVTATYVRADLDEVAAALSALTAEPHPLAPTTAGASSGPTIGSPPTWW